MRLARQVVRSVAVALFAGLLVIGASCNCGNPAVVDPDLPDAGPGLACGACTSDADCDSQGRCVAVTGGKACVPRCDTSKPSCPVGFTCKTPDEGGAAACVPDNGACCVDSDQDEYGRGIGCKGADCDDTRATMNPGQAETCNATDDNCNGMIDEGLGQTTCGVGACARTVDNCALGMAQVCTPGTPATETCNGVDEDCNGTVDDGLAALTCGVGVCQRTVPACVAGSAQTCTAGDAGTETCNGLDDDCNGQLDDGLGQTSCGVGACARTVDNCLDGGTTTCVPGAPGTEACNGIDDDCNGQLDEGLGQTTCGTGVCARTVDNCAGGMPQTCLPGMPGTEACNMLDDDCNGQVDDGLGQTSCGVGACRVTTANCVAGMTQACVPLDAGVEACNGLDDDCNGAVDDGVFSTTCGVGACQRTVAGCADGGAVACVPGSPAAETCNGLDDNCDGTTDESLGQTTCGTGTCQRTVDNCSGGMAQTCSPGSPSTETCNGLDDNCDGTTDEGLGQTTCGVGACQRTVQNCSGGTTQTCTPGSPSAEVCDGLDNNCNGLVDEGNPGGGAGCLSGLQGVCAIGTTACQSAAVVCVPNVLPGTLMESCDNQDNDCDGQVDEGNPGGGSSCSTGQPGICAAGMTVCSAGALQCQPQSMPSAEVCDGLDNNCNGATDEGNPGGGFACITGFPGVCSAGTTTCQSGAVGCVPTIAPGSQSESCDNLDNNCNGQVDEANPLTMCPPGANVSATTCSGGTCGIASCSAAAYNVDGVYANGCECADPAQTTCSAPYNIGSVSVGGTVTGPTNRAPALTGAGAEDWYVVSFPPTGASGSGRGGGRPTIEFAPGSDSQYRFDVYSDGCGRTARNCGRNNALPSSSGLTSWDFYDQNIDTAGTSQWTAPQNAWPTTVYVRVYRTTAALSCAEYQIRVRRP